MSNMSEIQLKSIPSFLLGRLRSVITGDCDHTDDRIFPELSLRSKGSAMRGTEKTRQDRHASCLALVAAIVLHLLNISFIATGSDHRENMFYPWRAM